MSAKQDKIRKELAAIRNDHGGSISAHHVVAFARNPKTALHSRFTWDDSRAAQAYRLEQARQVIRIFLTVVPSENADRVIEIDPVISPPNRMDGCGYIPMSQVLNNKQMRASLLREARAEMVHFRTRYAQLRELSKVFAAMDEVIHADEELPTAAP